MKLTTSHIRHLIKEEVTKIKFRGMIREMIESEFTRGILRDALKKSFLPKHLRATPIDVDDVLNKFIDANSETWEMILGNDSLEFLGSGRQGTAFQLGDRVLKLEPGRPRAMEIEDALYFSEDEKGKAGLPNVIDSGEMTSSAGPIGWSILEKFEDAGSLGKDEDWNALWGLIRDGITRLVKSEKAAFKDMDPDEIAVKLNLPEDLVLRVAEKFRLSGDWL